VLIEVLRNGPITPDMEAFDNPDPKELAALPKFVELTLGPKRKVDPRLADVVFDNRFTYVSVPLRNIGRGLATVTAVVTTKEGDTVTGWQATRPNVPPGETTRVDFILDIGGPEQQPQELSFLVAYSDIEDGKPVGARVTLEQDARTDKWHIARVEQDPEYRRQSNATHSS
jgi:hypothetical protein